MSAVVVVELVCLLVGTGTCLQNAYARTRSGRVEAALALACTELSGLGLFTMGVLWCVGRSTTPVYVAVVACVTGAVSSTVCLRHVTRPHRVPTRVGALVPASSCVMAVADVVADGVVFFHAEEGPGLQQSAVLLADTPPPVQGHRVLLMVGVDRSADGQLVLLDAVDLGAAKPDDDCGLTLLDAMSA